MQQNFKLKLILSKIEASKLECEKAKSYAEGYIDSVKDFFNNEINDFNKILKTKYDAEIRLDVYDELLPSLKDIDSQNPETTEDKSSDHPSARARSIMERLGR